MTATKKDISMVGFDIVAYAGDAKTDLIDALRRAKEGKFDEAEELVKSANESIVDAHNVQTKLLSQEAGGEEMDTTFIMTHAQDTLMTTMLLKDEIEFFIDQYRQIAQLKKEVLELKEG